MTDDYPRCSGCNRLSPTTLRNKGNGIYWCGRTACLQKVRDLIKAANAERSGADVLVEHMANCTDAQAAIVVDGSGDEVIYQLVAAGWTLQERTDYVAGKRIRFVTPPPGMKVGKE